MKVSSKNLLRAMGAGVIVVAAATPSWAQQAQGGFDKPLKGARGGTTTTMQPGTSTSTTMLREDDGENSYELRIDGDSISAKVNGKEVPQGRVVREGNEVRIMGKEGKVLKTFTIPQVESAGRGESRMRAQRGTRNRVQVAPMAPQAPDAPATAEPARKVMVGILMDKASDEQMEEAGLKDGAEAIVIQRVIPETPAERAGIQEGDLITEINGDKPATQEKLRDVLQDKKPGDTITLTVRRNNADKTVRVKLDKYDAKKVGSATMQGEAVTGMDPEALEELKNKFNIQMGPNGKTWVFKGPNGEQQFFAPGFSQGFTHGGDERLGELDKRMTELDERLEKLSQQMAKLEKMLQKMDKERGNNKD